MTTSERELYRGLAHTFRTIAGNDLRLADIARDRGNEPEARARRLQARSNIRQARRWDALAKMGAE